MRILICVFLLLAFQAARAEDERHFLTKSEAKSASYHIQYRILGLVRQHPMNERIRAQVEQAVRKLERVVTQRTEHAYVFPDDATLVPPTFGQQRLVKDLYVIIHLTQLAHADHVAEASILFTKRWRGADGAWKIFPVLGRIDLDRAVVYNDVRNGRSIYGVLLHELLHVMGVGYLWTIPDIGRSPDGYYQRFWIKDPDNNPHFVGPAQAKYNGLSATVFHYAQMLGGPQGIESVPLERQGSLSSALRHWDSIVEGDLLSAWDGHAGRLTSVSIANLEDLGYQVDYSEAEKLPQTASSLLP